MAFREILVSILPNDLHSLRFLSSAEVDTSCWCLVCESKKNVY